MAMYYEEHLVALLQPLGVYDLRKGTLNRGELAAYGMELDKAKAELDKTAQEMNLTTAREFGLELIEELLPYRPVCQTVQQRREALAALLRINGDSFTLKGINGTLSGCGLNTVAVETGRPNYVEVRFPDVMGIPDGFERMKVIIEEVLPSHLGITYVFWYNSWAELRQRHHTWGGAAATGLSWYGLATQRG